MSALKMVVTVAARSVASSGISAIRNTNPVFKFGYLSPMLATSATSTVHSRFFSFKNITKSMQYITNDDNLNIKMDPKTYKMVEQKERPLCIVLPWLLSKQKNVHKYAEIYLEQGYDVLTLQASTWDIMWPVTGSQLVAMEILKYLEANPQFTPIIMHGFSAGGYLWGEVNLHALKEPERYQPQMDRIKGQIWDSLTDVDQIPIGVARDQFIQFISLSVYFISSIDITKLIFKASIENRLHMKTFYNTSTVHYHKAARQFHYNMVTAPALFMLSKTDLVGTVKISKSVYDSFVERGVKSTWQCWDESPHVSHFLRHTEDYVTLMTNHFAGLNLLPYPEKMLARIPEKKKEAVLKNVINN